MLAKGDVVGPSGDIAKFVNLEVPQVLIMNWLRAVTVAAAMVSCGPCLAAQILTTTKADTPPTIDGMASDPAWSGATAVVTQARIAKIDVTIKSVYTSDRIYFIVTFPDENENRDHKTLRWVPEQERYNTGYNREDTFVFKWSMEPMPVDLSVAADNAYDADIWFWKAHRTDPAGYADDKMHRLSAAETRQASIIYSKNGLPYYLSRPSDNGTAAYRVQNYEKFVHDRMPKYRVGQPSGSRSDVRAKGMWRNGRWTIEFGRNLNTTHSDDVQFDPRQRYQFGISRYEIAGRRRNTKLDQPYYGAGDTGESLTLEFK